MKKTMILALLVVVMVFAASASAFAATPTINGTFTSAEWANSQPYAFYAKGTSDPHPDIADPYDLKTVVFLQNLVPADGLVGVYLGIETYAAPSLVDQEFPEYLSVLALGCWQKGHWFLC